MWLFRAVVELRSPGHPLRAHSLNNLAIVLEDRYRHTGSDDDLAERIRSLNNLANALGDRYSRTGSEDDLAETIRLHSEALELRPPGHPNRANSLNNLANALGYRCNRTGSEDDLAERIRLHSEALKLRTPGHRYHADSLGSLAGALGDRYRRTGSEDDLAESIRLHSEALKLRTPGHPDRAHSLNNLASVLSDRYHRTGLEDDLAESIRLYSEALKLRTPGHPDRADSLNDLAVALCNRYRHTGSEDDLAESIWLHSEALKLRPPGHPDRAHSLNNLAIALSDRYGRTSSHDDSAESIRLHSEALKLHTPGHPYRADSLNDLAVALCNRYRRTGSDDDLAESIRLHSEALKLRPPGHPDRAQSLNNLASALGGRYSRTSSEDDLTETIRLHREALGLRPPGHPDHAQSLNNLAIALSDRYRCTGSDYNLAEMICLNSEVLDLCPLGHPFHAAASMQLARSTWHSSNSPANIDEVFRLFKNGSTDLISPLSDSLKYTHEWVTWARENHHNQLGEVYDNFIRSLRRYLTIGPTIKLQYEALTRQANTLSLPMDAAAYFIQNGDVAKAVEILDEGRSLLWSEMRRFREPLQPAFVGDELGAAFETTCSELQRMSTAEATYATMSSSGRSGNAGASGISYDVLLNRKRKLLREYDELLGLIRKKSGFEDFLRSPPFKKLQEAASEGPVIIVNCSKFGSHVVIVFANRSPLVITLDKDFHDRAANIHRFYLDALQVTKNARNASRALGHKLQHVAQQLWDLVVAKVVDELDTAGVAKGSRIWWCPTSVLTALPLHAAGDGEHYLIDSYISSYTPTLKALIDSRQPPPPSILENSESELYPRLLVVAQTATPGLESAGDELDNMRSLGSFVDILDGPNATHQSVLQSLPTHDWAHFICHGTLAESGDAFGSSLHLHGGDTLSLNDIIKAHLPHAKFAFLAACHTAEQGRDESVLQDEILHLAGAMQFSGFRSVIGTMWEMEDMDGPKLAKLFYAEMLKGDADSSERHKRAARALWEITRRMKDKGCSLARWVNLVHIGA